MAALRDIARWIVPLPVAIAVGWATAALKDAPPPRAWTVAGVLDWLSVPFNWTYLIIGAAAGIASFIGVNKFFKPPPLDRTPDQLDTIIALLLRQPLSPQQAAEAGELATVALPDSPAGAGAASLPAYAGQIAAMAVSPDRAVREAAALELSGAPDEAIAALIALGEAETGQAATRFREAAALAAPRSVAQAISLYARATDLDSSDFSTWIELARLHQAAGSLAQSRRAAEAALQHMAGDRERMVAENTLGDIARDEGDLTRAARHYQAGMVAAQSLAAADPGHAGWQRDLSVSHNKLGDVAVSAGDLGEARAQFAKGLAIREHLAAADPGHAGWQRDLSVSHAKLGALAEAAGDREQAIDRFRAAEAVLVALLDRVGQHPQFTRDLAQVRRDLKRLGA